jgi:hypothetical protein
MDGRDGRPYHCWQRAKEVAPADHRARPSDF